MNEKEELIIKLSNNFTKIITIEEIKNNKSIYWGGNGVGNRFANKLFNYELIYKNKKTKKYSENDTDIINEELLKKYYDLYKSKKYYGIIGIFIFSKRLNIEKRPIRKDIKKIIKNQSCVSCGSNLDIICDHKNDLYNDKEVLDSKKQKVFDIKDITTKKDTYWYDPVEFNNKLFMYITYTLPIINEIKLKVKKNKLILIE